ncbi:MAG TPA: response regulator transcription factor [Micropepsaceae bacterium]|jgi:DNA-binding NarL/FixJ family response regulator|nr:response regulator transcription factor [Micropepsaceae bacterium]
MTDAKAKILLVDDHPLVREWLASLIEKNLDLTVCGEAEDAPTALRAIAEIHPDLAIIDLSLGVGSGIDLIRSIRSSFPDVAMIVLSMHDERVYAERTIRAGARGYVMKRETTKKIIDAIREVLRGNLYLSKEMTDLFVEKFMSSDSQDIGLPIAQLSDRELEVFKLIGQGYEINEIAKALNVNRKTIHTYCTRIRDKLKLNSSAELLREALRWTEAQSRV